MIQKGHCSCKQINYSFDNKKIINSFHCHCEDCQRSTGTGKASILVIKKSNFNLNGEPKFYGTKGSMGSTVNRGFCSNCGSGIFSYLKELPNFLFLKVGTLQDSSWVKIESNYFTKSCNKWNMPDEQLKSFKGNPNLLENIKTLIKSLN